MPSLEVELSHLQCILAFTLSTIGVDRSTWKTLVVQEVVDHIALALAIHKDKSALGLAREDEIKQRLVFLTLVHIHNRLSDVPVRATDTSDLDAQVIGVHILPSETASRLRKSCREHKVGMVSIGIDICEAVSKPPREEKVIVYLIQRTTSPWPPPSQKREARRPHR